jgi:Domain of unknown function (DUF4360)
MLSLSLMFPLSLGLLANVAAAFNPSSVRFSNVEFGQDCPVEIYATNDFAEERDAIEPIALKLKTQGHQYIASTEQVRTSSCKVSVVINKPAGWKMAVTNVEYWGYAHLNTFHSTGTFNSNFEIDSSVAVANALVSGPYQGGNYKAVRVASPKWSSCDALVQFNAFNYANLTVAVGQVGGQPEDLGIRQISYLFSVQEC